jgi:PAS domain S-box-containing protein
MRIYRKLLIVLLALSFIPVTFVSFVMFNSARVLLQREILSNLDSVADGATGRMEEYFSEREHDLLVIEHLDVIRKVLPELNRFCEDRANPSYRKAKEAIDFQIAPFQDTYEYVDIMLTNAEGRIIYAFAPEHEHEIGTFIHNRDEVIQKTRAGIYVGDAHKTTLDEHPYTAYLAAPVHVEGNSAPGLIRLEFDMRAIYGAMEGNPDLASSFEIMLVARAPDDKVLFISPLKYDPAALMTRSISIGSKEALSAQKSVSGESGSGSSTDYRGRATLAQWRPIPSTGWGLIAKVDSKEAFLPIEKIRNLLIVITLIIVCSTMMTAFSIAQSISKPIHELHRGVEIIESGILDHPVRTEIRDEIGQLSRAFDDMFANLRRTTVSKDYLDCIMASMTDSLIVIDPDAKIATVNMATCTLLGYEEEDLIGKDMGFLFPEDRIPFGSAEIMKSSKGGTLRNYETSYKTKDGRAIPVILSGGVLRRKECPDALPRNDCRLFMDRGSHCEKLLGAVWVARDITERKRAEGALAEIAKAKSDFASTISHELRTPLTAIKQGITIVLEGTAGAINEDQSDFLNLAKRNVDRLNRLINDVLDIQKFEAQETKSSIQENDINEMIIEVQNTMAPLADKKSLGFALHLEEGLPRIKCDRDRIVQVLTNLANNAIKFTEKGRIVIASSRGENTIRVSVKDTGPGIKEEDMDRLFRPFEQLGESPEPKTGATGLGLAISKEIISRHNGKIWAESEFGTGTTFSFILPIREKRTT